MEVTYFWIKKHARIEASSTQGEAEDFSDEHSLHTWSTPPAYYFRSNKCWRFNLNFWNGPRADTFTWPEGDGLWLLEAQREEIGLSEQKKQPSRAIKIFRAHQIRAWNQEHDNVGQSGYFIAEPFISYLGLLYIYILISLLCQINFNFSPFLWGAHLFRIFQDSSTLLWPPNRTFEFDSSTTNILW